MAILASDGLTVSPTSYHFPTRCLRIEISEKGRLCKHTRLPEKEATQSHVEPGVGPTGHRWTGRFPGRIPSEIAPRINGSFGAKRKRQGPREQGAGSVVLID